jgi:hypothetical protein
MPQFGRKADKGGSKRPLKLDAVAIERDGTVALILGHRRDQSLESLKEHLQAAVSFALDGQMEQMYPETRGQPIRIVVAPDDEPSAELVSLFGSSAPRFASFGIELTLRYT